MKFVIVRVYYVYPLSDPDKWYHKDYTVQENEPFPLAAAGKQWQLDHTIPHEIVAIVATETMEPDPSVPIIQLPFGFCETKYPGYFWNYNEQKLYSLKSGMLKEIPRRKWNGNRKHGPTDGYSVSHLGVRRHLRHVDMMKLVPTCAVIPYKPVPKRFGSRWR